jgi:2-polyprenyl-3-methyl-5-hydroxy-6-metoxy-1,4-benzoquinol methylase
MAATMAGARLAYFARARSRRVDSTTAATSELSQAVVRTVARYREARPADRHYVASKLRWDPITRVVHDLPVDWGSVLDVGCGRGQLGLLLVELGRVRVLRGFDWDKNKIETARLAAGDAALFELGDLANAELAPCDTVLVIDVLHYVSYDAQRELLRQVRTRLVPGGTLVVRDVDARPTLGSRLTQWFELIGTRLGINRGRQMYFLSSAELQKELGQLGFAVTDVIAMPGLTFDNVLVVAHA